jgi:transcriptional regulator with XRE-family HTH domain
MAPTTYSDVLARNIRAARARRGLGQESVAARMRALGYDGWVRQTVGSTEKPTRRVTADEIFGLSLVLGTTISALMAPVDEDKIVDFPGGEAISVVAVRLSAVGRILDGVIHWDGDKPEFTVPKLPPGLLDGLPGLWPPSQEG